MTRSRLTAAARRAQLVDVAIAVAEEGGVSAVRLRDVAQRAEVSLGTLHHFFPTKTQLMTSVARALSDELLDSIAVGVRLDTWDRPGVAGLEGLLTASLDALWHTVEQTANRQLVTYEMATHSLREGEDAGIAELVRSQYDANTERVCALLATMAEVTGTTWSVPVTSLGPMVLTFIDGLVLQWLIHHDDEAASVQRALIVRLIVGSAVES
ncbi:TetR/AcrR family transcriptional regulator [Gordonia sp. NPDC003376]